MEKKKITKEETEAEKVGGVIAAIGMIILSFIYFTLGIALQGKTNYGWYSMIALYCTLVFGYKGIKLKKKLDIVIAIIWLLMLIMTIIGYVNNLINDSTIL